MKHGLGVVLLFIVFAGIARDCDEGAKEIRLGVSDTVILRGNLE
jgi:hypothetical protein